MRSRLRDEAEADDPLLSVINLIDVFLVLIAALLLTVASNPLNPYAKDKITVIRNAGQADMEIITRDGKKIERFRADSQSKTAAAGNQGVRAGTAYRMSDGSLLYVPD
jgi:hypothetical protein